MSSVYIVTADCGDYYCTSCGFGHLVGISVEQEDAEAIAEKARRWASGPYTRYSTVRVDEFPLGTLVVDGD